MKKLLGLTLALLLIATPSYCGQWSKATPETTDQRADYPTDQQANNDAIDRMLSKYNTIRLTYSSASTIVASIGEVMVSNSAGTARLMLNNTSATNITFSDLDTGSEASATTYYVYAVAASATAETATFKISTSSTAPTGVTYYKRLGSFYNDSSSNITNPKNDNVLEFGDWESKTIGTTYQATTDGFLTVNGVRSSSVAYIDVVSDQSSSPSTVRCRSTSSDSGNVYVIGISCFAKEGDYYKANSSGNLTTQKMFWLPLE